MTTDTVKHRRTQLDNAKAELVFSGHAEAVLNNPAYIHAIQAIKADLIEKFARTTHDQEKEREVLWVRFKNMEDLEKTLERTMKNGPEALRKVHKLEKLIKSMLNRS